MLNLFQHLSSVIWSSEQEGVCMKTVEILKQVQVIRKGVHFRLYWGCTKNPKNQKENAHEKVYRTGCAFGKYDDGYCR